MIRPTLIRANDIVNRCLSYAGVTLLILYVAEAFWLRMSLGHWPVVYRDEPVGLVTTAFEISTSWLLVGLFFGSPFWATTLPGVAWRSGVRCAIQRSLLFIGSVAVIVTLGLFNVLGFAEWWLD